MKKKFQTSKEAFRMEGKMPFSQAIPLELQHVLAMFGGSGIVSAAIIINIVLPKDKKELDE